MSELVTSTIIDYLDSQNTALVYSTNGSLLPMHHQDSNLGEMEEGSEGPYIQTFVTEADWNKIDDQTKAVGGALTHTSLEEGQLILWIQVAKGLGTKDLRAQGVVADKLKRDLVKLELPTTNGLIHFGSSTTFPQVEVDREQEGRGLTPWLRTILIIDYYYADSYT